MKMFFKAMALVSAIAAVSAFALSGQSAASAHPAYSERQVFEGVALGHGPVAAVLGLPAAHWTAAETHDALCLERLIAAQRPGFFGSFGRGVTSGDPGLVNRALQSARVTLTAFRPQINSALLKSALVDQIAVVVVTNDTSVYVSQNVGYLWTPLPTENRSFASDAYSRLVARRLRR